MNRVTPTAFYSLFFFFFIYLLFPCDHSVAINDNNYYDSLFFLITILFLFSLYIFWQQVDLMFGVWNLNKICRLVRSHNAFLYWCHDIEWWVKPINVPRILNSIGIRFQLSPNSTPLLVIFFNWSNQDYLFHVTLASWKIWIIIINLLLVNTRLLSTF